MIVLNGKYNFAKIFLPNNKTDIIPWSYKFLDVATEQQINSFLNHPAFAKRKIRIMPDTHYGKGSCVGFTMDFADYIIPNIIGVDIGCGILSWKLSIPDKFWTLEELDNFIKRNIPHGFNIHKNQTDDFLEDGWFKEDLQYFCGYLELDYDRVINSVGTLGGGNHFIELGKDSEGSLWLTVHSGSRNFGLQVAKYFQSKADELCKAHFQDFGDLNFLHNSQTEFDEYLHAMKIAQQFADESRRRMLMTIVSGFFEGGILDEVNSVHNYIDLDEKIIRKGATDASEGKRLIIPFNMEEGFILGTGKGNEDWNNSAPHGAGRILSRNQAKKELDLEQAKTGMEEAGVFTTTLSQSSLDEAKGAYKAKELILEMIEPTVEVDTWVKPVYNFKDDSGRK